MWFIPIIFLLLSIAFSLSAGYATDKYIEKWYGFTVFLFSILLCAACVVATTVSTFQILGAN